MFTPLRTLSWFRQKRSGESLTHKVLERTNINNGYIILSMRSLLFKVNSYFSS